MRLKKIEMFIEERETIQRIYSIHVQQHGALNRLYCCIYENALVQKGSGLVVFH